MRVDVHKLLIEGHGVVCSGAAGKVLAVELALTERSPLRIEGLEARLDGTEDETGCRKALVVDYDILSDGGEENGACQTLTAGPNGPLGEQVVGECTVGTPLLDGGIDLGVGGVLVEFVDDDLPDDVSRDVATLGRRDTSDVAFRIGVNVGVWHRGDPVRIKRVINDVLQDVFAKAIDADSVLPSLEIGGARELGDVVLEISPRGDGRRSGHG